MSGSDERGESRRDYDTPTVGKSNVSPSFSLPCIYNGRMLTL